MKIDEDFMKNFRWITPLVVSITAILVTVLIAVVSNLTSEIRAVRTEVAESRKFAVQYTDKMIELILTTSDRKK